MNKIIISNEFDPYFNIASENELFLNSDEDLHLYLWQNDASVIVGRNQNLYAECDLAYMEEHNIKAVRRFSGGGAVYHDKGNLNFTFITKEKTANDAKFLELIQSAIAKLGIDCEFSGRNDLLYNGQKFSGHAYYTDGDNYMYHGTILVNVDSKKLAKALTPSKLKLQSKGISSVKSRVINLSSINSEITTKKVIQAFIDTFACQNIKYINKANFNAPLEQTLSSYEWLYAQSPSFDIELEHKYSIGNVSVYISCSDGVIQSIKINTDSLFLYNFNPCENELIGKDFSDKVVWACIEQYVNN
ncbi:MAG: lipoate--protein ligase [Oscillospiraceae bacterium]